MSIPNATAADLVAGRAESDAQDFNDELIPVDPYREVGENASAQANAETMDRAAEDLLVGLRQLQGGEEIRWAVHRVGEMDDTRNGFLIECATTNLTQTWLKDSFGGGTYRIRGHYPNGKYAAQRTIRVAGDAVRKIPAGHPVLGTPSAGGEFNLQSYLAQIDARDQRRRREEEDRRKYEEERDERRRKERMDMMIALAPALATALGGLLGRQDNTAALITALKPAPPPDPLAMMVQLKTLMGNNDQAGVAKILPMLIDMASSKATSGDTGWLDVVKELAKSAGPTIGGMIEMSVQQARANAAQASQQSEMSVSVAPASPAALPSQNGFPSSSMPPAGVIVVPEERRPRTGRFVPASSSAAGFPGPNGTPPPGAFPSNGAGTATGPLNPPTNGSGQSDMQLNLLALAPHLPWLKNQLARLGKAAEAQRNPEPYAAIFVEELPESIDVNTVGQLLSSDDWYGKLIQLEPRLNREDLVPWFTAVRNHILRLLRGPDAGATVPAVQAAGQTAPAPATPPARQQPKEIVRPTKAPNLDGTE